MRKMERIIPLPEKDWGWLVRIIYVKPVLGYRCVFEPPHNHLRVGSDGTACHLGETPCLKLASTKARMMIESTHTSYLG